MQESQDDCEPATTSAPVQYGTGQIQMLEDDLNAKSFGVRWGHTRSYANVLSNNATGVNGNSWLVQQFKALAFVDTTSDPNDPATIGMIDSGTESHWFGRPQSGVAKSKFGNRDRLTHDAGNQEFGWATARGHGGVFYDNSADQPAALRGKLKAVVNRAGKRVEPVYDGEGRVRSFAQEEQGKSSKFTYSHLTDGGGAGKLGVAQLDIDGKPVRRAKYGYFGSEAGGNYGDLRSVVVEQFDGATAQWGEVERKHYRYYEPGSSVGFAHALKYVVKGASNQRMVAAGLNPEEATDEQVAAYADHRFEYDNQQRVVNESVDGGRRQFALNYHNNPTLSAGEGVVAFLASSGVNTWATKTVETLPDGNQNRVYTNSAGQMLLKIFRETTTGKEWCTYTQYNDDFRVTLHATPAAVASVDEPTAGNGHTLTVNLHNNAGRIDENVYDTTTNPGTGAVEGYLEKRIVRKGTTGPAIPLESFTYETH